MKPNLQQLKKLQADPATFRAAIVVETDSGPQRLSTVVDDWQRADFEALDSGWRAIAGVGNVTNPVLRAWMERGRGHSKTSDIAVQICWALFASRRKLSGVVAAADRDQARLLRDALSKLVRLNPWLADFIDVQDFRIRNPHTDSTCDIIASDVASSYGLLCDFIVCDEVSNWQRRELWDSLLSTAAKKKHCLIFGILNSGFVDSWQWQLREAIRTDASWYFSRLDGPRASWITADCLAEQQRLLPPSAYARLWLNRWQSGAGDALNGDDITAAITQRGPMLQREPGFAYIMGADLSVVRDTTALVTLAVSVGFTEVRDVPQRKLVGTLAALVDHGIVEARRNEAERIEHPGTGRIQLADVRLWNPKDTGRVDFEQVERAIVDAHERYQLSAVAVDAYQAEMLCQRLARRGIPVFPISITGVVLRDMASCVLDQFRERNIDLYHHPELLCDLRNSRVVERQYGWRLESQRKENTEGTQHGDALSAFGIGLLAAKRAALRPARGVQGELVCYPNTSAA